MRAPLLCALAASASTALLVAGIAVCGGGAHREVDAAEFMALMKLPVSPTSHVALLGITSDRAWLTHWRAGLLGGGTTDVCSVPIDGLPAAEAAALRDGRNPWLSIAGTNDPGLAAPERDALLAMMRAPPSNPIVIVLRCANGRPASVARNHFDNAFTEDDVIPVPVPCDVIVITTADAAATLRIGGRELAQLQPGRAAGAWHHLHAPGAVDVVVQGSTTWQVQLRAVGAGEFYGTQFDQRRSKR
jgi:hypothetical protein